MVEIDKLLEDKAFTEKLDAVTSKAEAVKLFNDNGVEINDEQLSALMEYAVKGSELGEGELDNVSGGMSILAGIAAFKSSKKAIDKAAKKLEKTKFIKWWQNVVDSN